MAVSWRRGSAKTATLFALALLSVVALALLGSRPAGAGIVARDGKIHACYKVKGKGKGTLRVVRSAKAKCPKKWKKVAWYAAGVPGPQGEPGPKGDPGATGAQGLPGRNENVVVNELEDKVTELLTKVANLETVVANLGALETVVGSLCAQTEALNEQTTALGTTLGALNTAIDALLLGFSPVTVPPALPAYTCPTL